MTLSIMIYSKNPNVDGQGQIKFSTDYGANWTDPNVFTDDEPVVGIPGAFGMGVVIKAPNGNLIICSADALGSTKIVSTDGGKTWSAPSKITITGISAEQDAITYTIDQALILDSVIYVSCIVLVDEIDYHYMVDIVKSTDNGATWNYVGRPCGETFAGECGFTYIGDNTFIAIVRGMDDKLYKTHSHDLGVTWSPLIASGLHNGGRPHLYTRAQLKGQANWWTDPVLVMCGFIDVTEGIINIRKNCLWVSLNHGEIWSPEFTLDDEARLGGYGDMMYNPNTDEYIVIEHRPTSPTVSDIKQYNVTIDGI